MPEMPKSYQYCTVIQHECAQILAQGMVDPNESVKAIAQFHNCTEEEAIDKLEFIAVTLRLIR